ncbi:DUF4116 domain-containing protein, partial [Roseibium sp. RKSG952]|uniref:DUF4116 domain-containing protein n=1 Tax=Roseibium sp. RKSG952 TaxID=2529384 RepID=UPI0013CC97E7
MSGENGNAFLDHHQKAPFIIIDLKTTGKFQLWVTERLFYFRDADGVDISEEIITRNTERFLPLLEWAMTQNVTALQYIPEALQTPNIHFEAVRQDGRALCFVPEGLRTEEVCLEAVKQYGRALQYVP